MGNSRTREDDRDSVPPSKEEQMIGKARVTHDGGFEVTQYPLTEAGKKALTTNAKKL